MIPHTRTKSSLITMRRGDVHRSLMRPIARAWFLLAPLFALTLAATGPAAGVGAQEVSGGPHATIPHVARSRDVVQCAKCHGNREFLAGKAKTPHADSLLFVPDSVVHDSRHAKLTCAECHKGYDDGYPHKTGTSVRCESCHATQDTAYRLSIHAATPKTKDDAPTCRTCHGTHDVLAATDSRSPTYPLNVVATCATCHEDKKFVEHYYHDQKHKAARTVIADYKHTIHGTALTKDGLVVSATCTSCHGAHLVLPADSARSSINANNVAHTCGACHAGIETTFDSSSHGVALAKHKQTDTGHDAPVCVDCHKGHNVVPAADSIWFVGMVKECGSCHEKLVETYGETYHGQVSALGFGVTAKCSDCHTAHAMYPAMDPRSSVNQANIVATCARCHPGANAKFAAYKPHADPTNRAKDPWLFYVWIFMTGLLVSVFAFFGTHTLLWLLRLTIDALRGRAGEHQPKVQEQ